MRTVKVKTKSKLARLGFNQDMCNYISEAVSYCVKKNIHPMDINLNSVVYPHLSKVYDLHKHTIERHLMRATKEFRDDAICMKNFYTTFGYKNSPTVKKIIMFILLNKECLDD